MTLIWSTSPFWIQVHDLPRKFLNWKNATLIGEKFGNLIRVENPFIKGILIKPFLRFKTNVKITKSLLLGVWIPRKGHEKMWVKFKYDKL